MRIALCNIPIIWEDPYKNIELCNSIVDSIIRFDSGVELILFPEFFTYGFSVDSLLYEENEGISLTWMKEIAYKHNTAIYGSVPVKVGSFIYNRGYFVKPDKTFEFYDKRHLFSYGGENKLFTSGNKRVVVNYRGYRILLQICYDLRFPVWSRNRLNDYDLILNIASWPSSRSEVIKPLAIARAIENQSYYAFLNRSGNDPKSNYSGECFVATWESSLLIPHLSDKNNYFSIFHLNIDAVNKFRSKFPVWKDSDNFIINY